MQPDNNTLNESPGSAATQEERDTEWATSPAPDPVLVLAQHEPAAGDDQDDTIDSGVGEDVESTTTSLSSSVCAYVEKHGRRYTPRGTWFVPNDDAEQDRMDLRYAISLLVLKGCLLFNQNYINDAPTVLDIGTGTGLWAMDMADRYPGGEVVGTDLSPIQPHLVPPNCHFLVDDAEKTWEDSQKYNIVHLRYMEGAFKNWPWIFEQAMTVLEPGGIIEVHGMDFRPYAQEGEVPEVIQTWIAQLYGLTKRRGTPLDVTGSYETWMRAAGFEDVQKHEFAPPLGAWAKDEKQKVIGGLNLAATLNEIEAYSLEPFVEDGWSVEEATVLIARVRQAYQENCRKNELRTKVVIVTGRKPGRG